MKNTPSFSSLDLPLAALASPHLTKPILSWAAPSPHGPGPRPRQE